VETVTVVKLALVALGEVYFANHIHVAHDRGEAVEFVFCERPRTTRLISAAPSLILLDWKLLKFDGLEVLKRIPSNPRRTERIPVIVLTSSEEQRDLIKSYA
jgi:two-component system, response regulator